MKRRIGGRHRQREKPIKFKINRELNESETNLNLEICCVLSMNIRIILSSIKILIAITIESVTTNEYMQMARFFLAKKKTHK